MSKLINELKQEHEELTSIILELQKTGILSKKGFSLLLKSKTKLLEHLTKEDNYLYPVLYEEAKTDNFLKETLNIFGIEMEKITNQTFAFYEKYSDLNKIHKTEFIKDFSMLTVALKNRMMKEEIAIYKSFEDLGID